MKAVVREDEKSTDLFDLLQNSARESYSSPQIPGVGLPFCPKSCNTACVGIRKQSNGVSSVSISVVATAPQHRQILPWQTW